jgi:hypothetical protein
MDAFHFGHRPGFAAPEAAASLLSLRHALLATDLESPSELGPEKRKPEGNRASAGLKENQQGDFDGSAAPRQRQALLHDACRCGPGNFMACLTCLRWQRQHDHVAARLKNWRAA